MRQTVGGKEEGEEGGRVKLVKVLILNGSLGLSHDLVGFSVFQIWVTVTEQRSVAGLDLSCPWIEFLA